MSGLGRVLSEVDVGLVKLMGTKITMMGTKITIGELTVFPFAILK